MQQRHPIRHRVTARHHNVIVVVQETATRTEAEAIARRMAIVPDTSVDIEEIYDPAETDLTTFSRELSESVGWRSSDTTASEHSSA